MPKRILITVGAAVLALVTACSSSDKGGGGTSSPPASTSAASSTAPAAAGATISQTNGVLTGADGRTLYANTIDTVAKITCVGACAKEWPPVPGPATAAGPGLDASKLGTAVRPDGSKQVTYDGHPLYMFDEDKAAGDKKGEGVDDHGGKWHVATVTGISSAGASTSDGGDDSSAPPSGPPPSSTTY